MTNFRELLNKILPESFPQINDYFNKLDLDPSLPIFKLSLPELPEEPNYLDSLTDWLFCDN